MAPVPLRLDPAPLNVTVEVAPVNVPLLIQLALKIWAKVAPLNVQDAPKLTSLFTVMFWAAVKASDVAVPIVAVRFPAMVMPVAGMVLVTEPLVPVNTRWP